MAREVTETDAAGDAAGATTPKRRGRPPGGGNGRKVRRISEMRTVQDNQAGRRRRAKAHVIGEPKAPSSTPYTEPMEIGKRLQDDAIPYAQIWLQQMLEIANILRGAPAEMLQCRSLAEAVEAQRRTAFACADCWFDALQDSANHMDRTLRRQAGRRAA